MLTYDEMYEFMRFCEITNPSQYATDSTYLAAKKVRESLPENSGNIRNIPPAGPLLDFIRALSAPSSLAIAYSQQTSTTHLDDNSRGLIKFFNTTRPAFCMAMATAISLKDNNMLNQTHTQNMKDCKSTLHICVNDLALTQNVLNVVVKNLTSSTNTSGLNATWSNVLSTLKYLPSISIKDGKNPQLNQHYFTVENFETLARSLQDVAARLSQHEQDHSRRHYILAPYFGLLLIKNPGKITEMLELHEYIITKINRIGLKDPTIANIDNIIYLAAQYSLYKKEDLDYLITHFSASTSVWPAGVENWIIPRIQHYRVHHNVITTFQTFSILTAANLEAAFHFSDNVIALSALPKTLGVAIVQSIFNLICHSPLANAKARIAYFAQAENVTAALTFLEKNKEIPDDALPYLTAEYLTAITTNAEVREFMMTRLALIAQWQPIVLILSRAGILNLSNLEAIANHLDKIHNLAVQHGLVLSGNPEQSQQILQTILANPDDAPAFSVISRLREAEWLDREEEASLRKHHVEALIDFNICLMLLQQSELTEYIGNVKALLVQPEELKIVTRALQFAAPKHHILGGATTLEMIVAYSHQLEPILALLNAKEIVTEANIDMLILNIEHLEALRLALNEIEKHLTQAHFERVLLYPKHAMTIAKAIKVLPQAVEDYKLILAQPEHAYTVALALNYKEKAVENRELIIQHPEHALRLIRGIVILSDAKQAFEQGSPTFNDTKAVIIANPAYADVLAQSYVTLRQLIKVHAMHEFCLSLMRENPAQMGGITLVIKALGYCPESEFIEFLKQQSTAAEGIVTGIQQIKNRVNDTNEISRYLNLMILTARLADTTGPLKNQPLYQKFSTLSPDKQMSSEAIINELTQLNCDFSQILLGKIYFDSFFGDNTQLFGLQKAELLFRKVKPSSPWYFVAQRHLFETLCQLCDRTENTADFASYQQKMHAVVAILRNNQQESEFIARVDHYNNNNNFKRSSTLIPPRISDQSDTTEGKEGMIFKANCTSTQTEDGNSGIMTWKYATIIQCKQLEPVSQNNTANDHGTNFSNKDNSM